MRIGIDLIEIPRIRAACEKYGNRFIERILTPREAHYCFQKKNPYESIASRFAAKEAFAKAVGSGITSDVQWQDIEILRDRAGKPHLHLCRNPHQLVPEKISLSMSHTHDYAVAMVVIAD
jgi:holo-[acyl-carrier protein] synthase